MPTVNGIEFPEDATPQEIQEFLASEGGGAAPTPNATPEREYGVRKVARDAINAIPMVQNTAAAFLTAPLKLGGPVGMAASGAIGAGAGVTGELQRQLMLRGLLGDRQALDPSRMGPAAVEGGVAGLGGHVAGKVVGAAGGAFRGMAPALGRVKAALRGRPGLVGDIIAATDAIPVRKPPVVKPPLGSEFSPSAFKAQRAASRAEQGRTSNFSEVPKPATKIAHSDDMVGPPTKRIRKAKTPKQASPLVTKTVIVGAPKTGKTTLSKQLSGAPFHADDVKGLGWSEASDRTSQEFGKSEVVEGVAAARALRKWLLSNPTGKPAEEVIFLRHPHIEQSAGQKNMGKGVETVFNDIRSELQRRGVKITEPPLPKPRSRIRPARPSQSMRGASTPELARRATARVAAVNRLAPVPKPIEMDALLNQSLMLEEEMTRMGLDPFTKAQVRAAFRQGGR